MWPLRLRATAEGYCGHRLAYSLTVSIRGRNVTDRDTAPTLEPLAFLWILGRLWRLLRHRLTLRGGVVSWCHVQLCCRTPFVSCTVGLHGYSGLCASCALNDCERWVYSVYCVW
jgi:hypothetical protein